MQIIQGKELSELTGYQRANEQRNVLRDMGITFITRKDGTLATTDDWLNRKDCTVVAPDVGFNLSALNAGVQ